MGYAFGTMRFVGDRIVFPIILLGIIFPYEATVIPLYYDFQTCRSCTGTCSTPTGR